MQEGFEQPFLTPTLRVVHAVATIKSREDGPVTRLPPTPINATDYGRLMLASHAARFWSILPTNLTALANSHEAVTKVVTLLSRLTTPVPSRSPNTLMTFIADLGMPTLRSYGLIKRRIVHEDVNF